MTFDLRGFARFLWRWLRLPGWSLRRAGVVLAFLLAFPLLELAIWTGLALDRLFFPGFRRQPVRAPVFIVGNFRSGTTFFHRLLARDVNRFCSMTMWEILFAPSITARRVVDGFARAERWLGRPVGRLIGAIERRMHQDVVVHEISLGAPEEDDYLWLHSWSAQIAGLSSGVLAESLPYVFFDRDVPAPRRTRLMHYYRACLQRHLYARGSEQVYLAKNPALTPKLASVLETFPDARIVHLVRNPLETVPSFVSMMQWSWRAVGTPVPPERLREFAFAMAGHWYRYPLEIFERLPPEQRAILKYDDLVADPAGCVRRLYAQWKLPIDAQFEAELAAQAAQARAFSSRHVYDLAELGLTREEIVTAFADIFERFGFDTKD